MRKMCNKCSFFRCGVWSSSSMTALRTVLNEFMANNPVERKKKKEQQICWPNQPPTYVSKSNQKSIG